MRSRHVKNRTFDRERSKRYCQGQPRSVGTVGAEGGNEGVQLVFDSAGIFSSVSSSEFLVLFQPLLEVNIFSVQRVFEIPGVSLTCFY